jgi:hypothetical protein
MTSSFLPLAWPSVFVSLSRLEFEAGSAHFPTHVAAGCSNGRTVVWPLKTCAGPPTLPSSRQWVVS